MKIALIGYGKMGKAIEQIAIKKGHTIALTISSTNAHECTPENFSNIDVAIEFTGPETVLQHLTMCATNNIPVVCGSTGWNNHIEDITKLFDQHNGSLLYASNFSIGVNVFFEINKKLAQLMKERSTYTVTLEETHHTAKKDAPSGTAITLAEQIIQDNHHLHSWVCNKQAQQDQLTITAKRIDPAPGTHHVKWHSAIDDIEIIHTAHNREGFAEGAVIAAEFLFGKKGVFTMRDVLGL